MRGLFLDNLTGLVGDVFKGVANSTSRMKESVLFHNGEEEKKYKQMEERKNKEVAKLKEELKERDKQVEERNKLIKAKEEELKTREEKAKEDDAKHKKEVAKLKAEVEETNKQIEERNKQIKAKEDELKTREERAKEDEAKYKEEVAKLKSEVEETNKQVEETNKQVEETNKQMEETNKQIKAKEKELKTKEEKIDKFKKQLEYKDGIIRELRTYSAGLKTAFDLNAGVTMQMEDLAAKEEAANLKAASFKRSRQELEETTGPAVKKVCLAVKQLGSKKQEVVANGLQVIEASAKIIGPAVAQSKNKKRREERGRSKKGNQYCCICKDFFRLDL